MINGLVRWHPHQIDVDRGKLALKHTHNDEVKQFADQMVHDHQAGIKEATDLNNRLVSENAMLQIAIARLSAVQGNLSASAENDRVQTQATRTELLRFDSNYQYRVRQP